MFDCSFSNGNGRWSCICDAEKCVADVWRNQSCSALYCWFCGIEAVLGLFSITESKYV